MGLKDIGSKLPPGFRFHPSDEELVCHYLCNKIRAKSDHGDDDDDDDESLKGATDLVEIDLHICEPWQLPGNILFYYCVYICSFFPLVAFGGFQIAFVKILKTFH